MYRSRSHSTRRDDYGASSSSSSGMLDSRSSSTSRRRADSSSRSRSRSRSNRRSPSRKSHKSSFLKGSVGLLAGIGIAAYAAHKIWPRGILYGAKEDWETRETANKQPNRRIRKRSGLCKDDAALERDMSTRRDTRAGLRDPRRGEELLQQRGRRENRQSWAGPEGRDVAFETPRIMESRGLSSRYHQGQDDGFDYALNRSAVGWRR